MGAEFHLLLAGRCIDHRRLSIFQVLADPIPDRIPHAAAHVPHVDAGVDLTQPFGQISPQARRAAGHRQNYNGSSPSSQAA